MRGKMRKRDCIEKRPMERDRERKTEWEIARKRVGAATL